jgi:hypothetical protein
MQGGISNMQLPVIDINMVSTVQERLILLSCCANAVRNVQALFSERSCYRSYRPTWRRTI